MRRFRKGRSGLVEVAASVEAGALTLHVRDDGAGIDEIVKRAKVAKVGAIGFCFGGGMSNTLAWRLPDIIKAAVPYYGGQATAENAAKNRLEVPPDLTRPQLNNNYALPGASSVSAQQLNQQAQANLLNKNPSNVLIDIPVARMERAGQQRWLVVQKKPEELWPLLKEFWIDNGFILKQDAPEIGVMETDWAENRSKLPKDFIRNTLGRIIDSASPPSIASKICRTPMARSISVSSSRM